jgi:ketosteroid isomerase-like protein
MPNLRRFLSASYLFTIGALSLSVLGGTSLTSRVARADNSSPGCSHELNDRTAEQTIQQHIALLQAGNLDQAMCDFSDDAVIVLPGQLVSGLDNIRAGLSGIGALLGGAVPQVTSLTATPNVVLITFSAFGIPCTIPDGSDTYIVKNGHITTQTVHDRFFSAPGYTCPVAAPGS